VKEVKEERDKAVRLIKGFMALNDRTDDLVSSDVYHFMGNDVLPFLDLLNQQNEAK